MFRKYMFAKFSYILPCSGKLTMFIKHALENLAKTTPKVRFLLLLSIKPIFSKHFHVMRTLLLTGTIAGHPGLSLFPLDDRREERQGGSKKGRLRGCGRAFGDSGCIHLRLFSHTSPAILRHSSCS